MEKKKFDDFSGIILTFDQKKGELHISEISHYLGGLDKTYRKMKTRNDVLNCMREFLSHFEEKELEEEPRQEPNKFHQEHLYKCIEDYQNTNFCVGEVMTAKDWSERALEWSDSDGWEEEDRKRCKLSYWKTEQELIDFIQSIWQIKIIPYGYKLVGEYEPPTRHYEIQLQEPRAFDLRNYEDVIAKRAYENARLAFENANRDWKELVVDSWQPYFEDTTTNNN